MVLVFGAVDDFDVTYVNGTAIGATGAETPHHWETARIYRFPARLLRRGRPNTLLVKVENGAYDGGIDGPVVIGPAAALEAVELGGSPLVDLTETREGRAAVLKMTTRAEGYEYRMDYLLPDGQPWFARQLTVRNVGADAKLLQNVACATPPLRVGPQQAVVFPGSLPVGDTPIASLQKPQWLRPPQRRSAGRAVGCHEAARAGHLVSCEEEFSPVTVRRSGEGAEIRHVPADRGPIEAGPGGHAGQAVLLARPRLARRGAAAACSRRIVPSSCGLPITGWPTCGEMVLYCGHPGGTPEQHFRGYGGFAAMRRYVPTLKKMGIDLLWLLPIWEHGDGQKWNLYAPFDHFRISPLYGTPEELKELSTAGRAKRHPADVRPGPARSAGLHAAGQGAPRVGQPRCRRETSVRVGRSTLLTMPIQAGRTTCAAPPNGTRGSTAPSGRGWTAGQAAP